MVNSKPARIRTYPTFFMSIFISLNAIES
jgi:hypothetical protein